MTVPPPGADGGFFASPIPSQQQPFQPEQPSYGPPARFGSPPPATTLPSQTTTAGPPPFVVGAVTSLVIAGVAAAWVGLSMLTLVSSFGGVGGGGLGSRGVFLLVNGVLDLGLGYVLLRGLDQARWAATAVCGFWLLYWLYQVTRATQAFSDIGLAPAGFGFGRLTFMATLGLLLLAAWPAATATLLWFSASTKHFSRS
ncbi:MAG: hypothetical protein JWM40_1225 [Frankiales bacterium]|nr:hypothetical protein [Frankiales bacterium]